MRYCQTLHIEGYFPIPAEYMPNTDCFMLKVKGESMINAGTFESSSGARDAGAEAVFVSLSPYTAPEALILLPSLA